LKTNFSIRLMSAGKKLLVMTILGGFAFAAFATLGDGKAGRAKPRKMLSTKISNHSTSFSLRSGYTFRGREIINFDQSRSVNFNTVVTYQQGNATYSMPLKKKVILNNKITFNPNAATRR
jgi:hypothetical protein